MMGILQRSASMNQCLLPLALCSRRFHDPIYSSIPQFPGPFVKSLFPCYKPSPRTEALEPHPELQFPDIICFALSACCSRTQTGNRQIWQRGHVSQPWAQCGSVNHALVVPDGGVFLGTEHTCFSYAGCLRIAL